MTILIVALGVVFFIWVIALVIQRMDKQSRERYIKMKADERKKEQEKKETPYFRGKTKT